MKLATPRVLRLGLILIGAVAFIAVGQLVNRWQPRAPEPPPGWQIIRPPHDVTALAESGTIIWAGGLDGIYAIDRKTGALIEKPEPDFTLEYVQALIIDEMGTLWIGHGSGLTRYDGSDWHTYTEGDGLPSSRISAMLRDGKDRLWAGTDAGIAVYDGCKWETPISTDELIDASINVMLLDSTGGMWFGSQSAPRGGISYLRQGKWQHFSTANGLPHNEVTTLFETSSSSVWAGTGLFDRGGACRFERNNDGWAIAQTLTSKDGLAGERVRSIFQDRDGVMWFGSEYDGLARYDGSEWSVFTEADGLAASEIKTMLQDADGDLWLGTTDGLSRIGRDALAAMSTEDNHR